MATEEPCLLFDLDGTLVDSVYQHVVAWRVALAAGGLELASWQIHRLVGMSGGVLLKAVARELGTEFSAKQVKALETGHALALDDLSSQISPLPGAVALLDQLSRWDVSWNIATSGSRTSSRPHLANLGVPRSVPAVTRDDVSSAKPNPDPFVLAAERLGVDVANSIVIGDSVWDILAARRAGALGVGLLSGGLSRPELEAAGAIRVYTGPDELHEHLEELGIQR